MQARVEWLLSTSWENSLGHVSGWGAAMTAETAISETVDGIVARFDPFRG